MFKTEISQLYAVASILFAALLAAPLPALAEADAVPGVQLSLEFYSDDATHVASSQILPGAEDTAEAEVGRGPAFALSLAYLLPLFDELRIGPGIRYLSSYNYTEDEAEEEAADNDEDAPDILLGRMFEIYARGEFDVELMKGLTLAPAIELGLPILFASGELQEELNARDREGYNVNSLPRMGFLVGAELGARYHLHEFLYLRAGLGIQHTRIVLYDASVDSGRGLASRRLSLMRIRVFIGVEATL